MRNIVVYLLITLLCLGTSIVFSEHNENSNNYGHAEWGRNWNSNTHAGKRYNDEWFKNAEDLSSPFSVSCNVKTTTGRVPTLMYSYASWKAEAEIRCKSHFYKGYPAVHAKITVDGDVKDNHYGNYWTTGYTSPPFEGMHKDKAKAYHSEHKTGQGQHALPSVLASDCYASGSMYGRAYDMNWNGAISSHAHIPW